MRNRTLPSLGLCFVGVESTELVASRLLKRGGDSSGLREDKSSVNSGGIGIVGIEYSLGNAYDELGGNFLCLDDDDSPPNKLVFCTGADTDSPDSTDEAGETPLIFESN